MVAEERFDLLVLRAESRDDAGDLRVIGGEVGGAVPGHQRDLVLRQQPLAHEAQQRVESLRRLLQPPAPEDDQEEPPVLRRQSTSTRP